MPDSRLEVFEGAGHFPFRDDPARFVAVLTQLHGGDRAGHLDESSIRALRSDPRRSRRERAA